VTETVREMKAFSKRDGLRREEEEEEEPTFLQQH